MGEQETDLTCCEYRECQATAFRVLFWGPRKTGPARAACWQHEGETDVAEFRDDLTTHPAEQPERDA